MYCYQDEVLDLQMLEEPEMDMGEFKSSSTPAVSSKKCKGLVTGAITVVAISSVSLFCSGN